MAPTIQTAVNPEKRPAVGLGGRTGEKRSELVCRVKYCNTLPDIPFDPKFITYPFDSSRFIQYNPTSLERNYKYDILTEHDLGVTIDLINRELYSGEFGAQLDPADEKLLEEDVLTPQDSKRSRHHARSVSWLRRTEYISTEQTRFQPQTMDKVEAKVGYSIKKNFKDDTLYMDRESQIRAIDKTFADSKLPVEKHYSKPSVVPLEILPVFPDFKVWKYPCAQVIFDSDPAPTGRPLPAQIEEMSQAMIRGVMDESGEQFVAYFLPTDETMEKRRQDIADGVEYVDEQEYEYKMAREYNWNVKSKASKGYEENYFLVVRPEGVYYNELETRVRLSKRRQKQGQPPNNTRLVVQHRTLNAAEFQGQRFREKQLEPPGEDEEEEDEAAVEELEESQQEEEGEKEAEDDPVKGGGSDKGDKSDADGDKSDGEAARSKSSGSRNSSRGSSRSRSASPAKSVKQRGTRSVRSRSRSASVAKSGRSRSGSGSPAKSTRSHSGSRSRSGSPDKSGRSRSGSPEKSGRSRSGSPEKSGRSRSGSPEKSGRSRSGSPEKSGRSRSGSPEKSGRSRSGSPEKSGRSRSGSPEKSGRSRSASPEKSGRSRSGSPAKSGRSRSASPEKSERSRSGSPEKSGRSRSGSPEKDVHSRRSRSMSVAKSNKSSVSGSGSSSGSASESEG